MSQHQHHQKRSSTFQFFICFFGIFFSYLIFGIIQEAITKSQYGDGTDRFTFTLCLVFIQCIANALFSMAILKWNRSENEGRNDTTPRWMYAICSLTYLGAMLASNEALQHVSYPTQVLGKSIKPVPVMLLGVLLARKRYPLIKYICVLLIVIGVALFMHTSKSKHSVKAAEEVKVEEAATATDVLASIHPFALIGFGELLLMISLALDGFTGAIQDRMNTHHTTKTHSMMYNINMWSCLWLFVGVLLTGELFELFLFAQKYPYVLYYMLLFSFAGAIGQHFIFTTITTFGPLACSIITTTRKFFTILGSVIIFNNSLQSLQWFGVVCVFVGLLADHKYGKEVKKVKA